jgi:hypothetical protein
MLQQILPYISYYYLLAYSLFGFILLALGMKIRKKWFVNLSLIFFVLPISGMTIHDLASFRQTESINTRLVLTVIYSVFSIFLTFISKRKTNQKAGFLVWILVFLNLILVAITGFSYFQKGVRFDEKDRVLTQEEKKIEMEDAKAYLANIVLNNIRAESYKDIDEGPSILVKGEIKNNGDKAIGSLTLNVILYNPQKLDIYSEKLDIIAEQKPLLPGKEKVFQWRLNKTPMDWQEGSINCSIYSFKLMGQHLKTTLEQGNDNNHRDK